MRLRNSISICLAVIVGLLLGISPVVRQSYAESFLPSNDWNTYYAYHDTIWRTLTDNFGLQHHTNDYLVKREIRFFSRDQVYITELTENARPYIYYVLQQTRARHMPAELALLPMIESDYDPFSISSVGATGLWQMMPGTASGSGLHINWWYDGRRNIVASTNAALNYLQYLHQYFGNWLLAIAAYNSGAGTVENAIRYNIHHHRPTDFWSLPLPEQTKLYVPKLLALATIIKNPYRYHLKLYPVPNAPFFTPIKMHGQIALKQIAEWSKTSLSMVRLLNPAFRRWTTDPKGVYYLLLPNAKVAAFEQKLLSYKKEAVNWAHHLVQVGDTISALATHYHTSTFAIERANHLENGMIHPGQTLLIPLSHNKHVTAPTNYEGRKISEDHAPGPQQINYVVKKHDSLWTIAKAFHVTPTDIRYWNKLSHWADLHSGENLVMWVRNAKEFEYSHYTVKPGDTLGRIADINGTTVADIKLVNGLHNNILHAGEKLSIPHPLPGHTHLVIHNVARGETLDGIASEYGVTTKALTKWNNLGKQKYLQINQPLKIYSKS